MERDLSLLRCAQAHEWERDSGDREARSLPGIKNTSVQGARSRESTRKPAAAPFEHVGMRNAQTCDSRVTAGPRAFRRKSPPRSTRPTARASCVAASGGKHLCENTSWSGFPGQCHGRTWGITIKPWLGSRRTPQKPMSPIPVAILLLLDEPELSDSVVMTARHT